MAVTTRNNNIHNIDDFNEDEYYFEHDLTELDELFESAKKDVNIELSVLDVIDKDMQRKKKKKRRRKVYKGPFRIVDEKGTVYDCVTDLKEFSMAHWEEYGYKNFRTLLTTLRYTINTNDKFKNKKRKWQIRSISG